MIKSFLPGMPYVALENREIKPCLHSSYANSFLLFSRSGDDSSLSATRAYPQLICKVAGIGMLYKIAHSGSFHIFSLSLTHSPPPASLSLPSLSHTNMCVTVVTEKL